MRARVAFVIICAMTINDYIYMDCAASNPDGRFAVVDEFANPSSTHSAGRDSFKVLDNARETLMHCVGAKRPSEIVFTSGATEANNIAIFGIARAVRRAKEAEGFSGKLRVITSAIEHESVLKPCEQLQREGFDVVFLPVDEHGFISQADFKNALDDSCVLCTIQLANSEVGVIQDLTPLVKSAHEAGAYFHTDVVGAFGKIPLNLQYYEVDAASFSGHKIGAQKGIGALYVKAGTPIEPIVFGSGQEGGLRSGTQNVAGAAEMAKAANHLNSMIFEEEDRLRKIRDYIYDKVHTLPGVHATVLEDNSTNHKYLPNLLHIYFENKNNQDLILAYDKLGIEISGGPACQSSHADEPSYVLAALGMAPKNARGALRISFGYPTTMEFADKFIKATKELV